MYLETESAQVSFQGICGVQESVQVYETRFTSKQYPSILKKGPRVSKLAYFKITTCIKILTQCGPNESTGASVVQNYTVLLCVYMHKSVCVCVYVSVLYFSVRG